MTRREEDRERIISATVELLLRGSLGRLTMAEISRASGVPRATLYTHFSSKAEVLGALLLAEQQRFMTTIDVRDDPAEPDDERMVRAFCTTVHMLRTHAVLRRLLAEEPDVVLPVIISGSEVMHIAQAWTQTRLADAQAPAPPDPQDAAEYVSRLLFSLMLFEHSHYDLDDPDQVAELARRWVLPVVFPSDLRRSTP